MINAFLDIKILNRFDEPLHIALELENRSQQTLSEFSICFDMPRLLAPECLVNTSLIRQEGSHIELSAPQDIPSGETWLFEIKSHGPALKNTAECPVGIYLRAETGLFDVGSQIKMNQPEELSNAKFVLPTLKAGIIPQPNNVIHKDGTFTLRDSLTVASSDLAEHASNWFAEKLNVQVIAASSSDAALAFVDVDEREIAEEAYQLKIDNEKVIIHASSASGFLYGAVSLAQLLITNGRKAPCCEIQDAPRFKYRGQFLDCSRSFHTIETVKSVIEQMVWLKFNHFHWHLTDDEGWRLEIAAYPQLTETGAWRGDSQALKPQFGSGTQKYGGFFTKDEVRDVIEFAARRGITVIPEIDVPGHARALIKSLPELLIETDDQSEYVSIQQYSDNVLNPGLDATYEVLETILDEVCELFPSPMVHLGGDEVPEHVWEKSPACLKKQKELGLDDVRELGRHLFRHLQDHLRKRGKNTGCWEEAIDGKKVDEQAFIYTWSSPEKIAQALSGDYPVVACPAQFTYFDMAVNNDIHETGVLWANPVSLKKTYSFEPTFGLTDNIDKIVGTQALVWTEFVKDKATLDYLNYPRLFALSEVAWTQESNKDFGAFLPRLSAHTAHLHTLGISGSAVLPE
ncbi:beta-hexosaminidase [Veronia nyctiphanis]|uniref:beta-N-acetylhexosaminidase n=1 Tax=Veronia nyctiphanis TaxID=1278244 RepID=A0A4Q0YRE5_9GAMM|nr:beta-N-acetylhexosaminidase [Veronia nyctiphanis]RXJ73173.1 beta-hexosaminidase [Veronia nyctiphanis]